MENHGDFYEINLKIIDEDDQVIEILFHILQIIFVIFYLL